MKSYFREEHAESDKENVNPDDEDQESDIDEYDE